jgi:peptidoglycan hydrolase-like amidase
MMLKKIAFITALFILAIGPFPFGSNKVIQSELYQNISVTMYPLKRDGSIDKDQQPPLCQPDDPSTPQNEADTRYGCTAFDKDHYPSAQVRPYPYATNPATVSIEDDYLLDVVAREMGPSYHPLALRAQTIVARTYAYCAMRAN